MPDIKAEENAAADPYAGLTPVMRQWRMMREKVPG